MEGGLEDLLDRLEAAIGKLADGKAPLEALVTSHEEAVRLVEEAELRLAALSTRAGRIEASDPP